MSTPLVSIALPARNSERTLRQAVRSIINQTYPYWELLLMEDGSTDATLSIARSFGDPRIKVATDGRSRGMTMRLNQAIQAAQGQYYARMDADDVAYPQRLERQVAYMQSHPGLDLVGAWVVVFDQAGQAIGKRAGAEDHAAICARPHAGFLIVHPTFLGRLDWFKAHPYDERISYSQDQDLLLRCHTTSRYANVPEVLLGYREGKINLRKMLTGRREIAGSVVRYFGKQGRWLMATRGGAGQALKLLVDVVAVGTRLNYRLVRQRARPISQAERERWEEVWKGVQG